MINNSPLHIGKFSTYKKGGGGFFLYIGKFSIYKRGGIIYIEKFNIMIKLNYITLSIKKYH